METKFTNLDLYIPPDNGIIRQRPTSAYSTGSGTYHTVGEIDINSPQPTSSQPIYAVPNKKQERTKRHTMHAVGTTSAAPRDPSAVVQIVPLASANKAVVETTNEHVYSQVDKTRKKTTSRKKQEHSKHGAACGASYDNISDSFIRRSQEGGSGVRPKLLPHNTNRDSNHNDHPASRKDSISSTGATRTDMNTSGGGAIARRDQPAGTRAGGTAGYHTIGSVSNMAIEDDPDYDTVQEGAAIIIDPYDGYDYESLPGSAAAVTIRGGGGSADPAAVATQNGGVLATAAVAALSNGSSSSAADRNANTFQSSSSQGGSTVDMNRSRSPVVVTHDSNAATDANRNSMSSSMHASTHHNGGGAINNGEPLVHINDHQPRSQPYNRREHIYEVITDRATGQENIYTADPTRHVMSRGRHHGVTAGVTGVASGVTGIRGSRTGSSGDHVTTQEFVSSL